MTQTDAANAMIQVLEDEPEIGRLICDALGEYGFRSELTGTGRQFLMRARLNNPDLCIIDLGLPDMDGMQVVRELQEKQPCAVLILTGRNDVTDRVLGLELGADDYIVKPFEPRELVARVRSILRRYHRSAQASEGGSGQQLARFSGWQFDTQRLLLVAADGREIHLSAAEAGLLTTLLKRPNKVLNREQLLGEREVDPFDRSIDVRISRLRRKLEEDPQNPRIIKTVYGAGYMLTTSVDWS